MPECWWRPSSSGDRARSARAGPPAAMIVGSEGVAAPEGARVAQVRNAGGTVSELKDLLVTYAKQETVDPVKSLGRYLGYGLAGSVLVGLSAIFLPLALLRALQAETGTALTGNWSWVPYAATLAAVAVVMGLLLFGLARVKGSQAPRFTDDGPTGGGTVGARSER